MSENSVAKFLRDANVRVVRTNQVAVPRKRPLRPFPKPQTLAPRVLAPLARPRPAPVPPRVLAPLRRPTPTRRVVARPRRRRRAFSLPKLTRNAKGQLLLEGVRCTPNNFRKRRLAYCAKCLGWKPRVGVTKARLCEIIRKRANLPRITLLRIKRDILSQKKRRISAKDLDQYAREAREIIYALGSPSREIQRRVAREVAKK